MINTHELQAVVLAGGPGSRMYPLTESTPKGLVPVANTSLISFVINNLSAEGFKEVIVVIRDTDVQLRNYLLDNFEISVSLATIKSSGDDDVGTADALRAIKDKITSDFLLVSCDLVGYVNIRDMLDVHRLRDADVTCVFSQISEAELTAKNTDGDVFYVGSDESNGRLLYYAAAADLDDDVTVLKSLLHRHPRIRMRSDYLDLHMYIFKRWVIDLVLEKKSMISVREELVPLLVRRQFRQHRAKADNPADVYKFVPKDGHMFDKEDSLRCYVYFQNTPCFRANSLLRYSEANRAALSMPMFDSVARLGADTIIGKTQMAKDSMVGSSCKIGDRCSIKKSIIGSHCTIGSNVKLSNCIIMDHVRIEDGANLVNTIVCKNAYISENADLKDCQVAAAFTVEANTQAKNESFSNRGLL